MRLVSLDNIKLSLTLTILAIFFSISSLILTGDEAAAVQSEDERMAGLTEGAKKEGKVLWYTPATVEESNRLLKRFREKYPYIETAMYRSNEQNILNRILIESQAKRHLFDVVMVTGIVGETLKNRGFLTEYLSPQRKFYPEGLQDPAGFWTDLTMSLNVVGYNTKLVSAREAPKTWLDLLNPKWKRKMGMDDKAFYWFANMLKVMGEEKGLEYMKKLSQQDIVFRTGRTLNAQMLAAGEFSIGIALYNHRIEEMKAQGAPIEWIPIEPVVPEIHPLGISSHAPHPNAARLLVDFLLSREGQEMIASFYKIPSRSDVEPIVPRLKKGFNILPFDLSVVNNFEKYIKLYREILLRGKNR